MKVGEPNLNANVGEPRQLFTVSLHLAPEFLREHVGEKVETDIVLYGKLPGGARPIHRIGSTKLSLKVKKPVEVKPSFLSLAADLSESVDLHFFSRDGKRLISPDRIQILGDDGNRLENVEFFVISPRWIRIRILRNDLIEMRKTTKRIELRSTDEQFGVASDFVDFID
jgi:hypothetical protein